MLCDHSKVLPTSPLTKGFTLVEVLVALASMAWLAWMGWQGIDTLVRSRETTQSRIEAQALVQVSLLQWRTDLTAWQPMPDLVNGQGMDWDGRVFRLVRRSTIIQHTSHDPGLQVVGWRVSGGHWLRWQSMPFTQHADFQHAWADARAWGQSQDAMVPQRVTQLMPLQSWEMFHYRLNAWSHPLSGEHTLESIQTTVPDAIRVVLHLAGSQPLNPPSSDQPQAAANPTITLDWVRPAFRPVAGTDNP